MRRVLLASSWKQGCAPINSPALCKAACGAVDSVSCHTLASSLLELVQLCSQTPTVFDNGLRIVLLEAPTGAGDGEGAVPTTSLALAPQHPVLHGARTILLIIGSEAHGVHPIISEFCHLRVFVAPTRHTFTSTAPSSDDPVLRSLLELPTDPPTLLDSINVASATSLALHTFSTCAFDNPT
uniref:Serine/threonine-protein phosphatase 2A 56 kDa regulatory subunit gamma isoform n=1 Tax=Lygus hesperus TaxID=30085 RepID=A0A0A9WNG8_LYGHE